MNTGDAPERAGEKAPRTALNRDDIQGGIQGGWEGAARRGHWKPSRGAGARLDHRLVSSLVTQVFQAAEGDTPGQLFYAGLPAERLEALAQSGALAQSDDY
jgi:hypothetical protein